MPFDSLPEYDKVDLLLLAARQCVEKGWCQHTGHRNDHEQHCVLGAIDYVGSDLRITKLAVHRFFESLPNLYHNGIFYDNGGNYAQVVAKWNDRKSRTKRQVLAQFDLVTKTRAAAFT